MQHACTWGNRTVYAVWRHDSSPCPNEQPTLLCICNCSDSSQWTLPYTSRRAARGPHRETAHSPCHGGIYDNIIIDIEEVTVFANAVVQLLAVIRHFGPQQISPVLNHHAVLLHFLPSYQAPTMNARLQQHTHTHIINMRKSAQYYQSGDTQGNLAL